MKKNLLSWKENIPGTHLKYFEVYTKIDIERSY